MLVYTSLCTEDGGIFDDLVVFCLAPDHYLLTMAAFNTHKTPGWVEKHTAGMNVCVMDRSAGTTCIEIQGPKSRRILQRIAEFDVSDEALPYYRFVNGKVAGIDCLVARLGVTGELGYEIFYDAGYAWTMYDAFVKAGKEDGLALCGNRTIGTFRLEKVYHVYTRDMDETTNPYEAGLGWTVKLDKGDFIGRARAREDQRDRAGAQAGRLRNRRQAGDGGGQEPDQGRHGKASATSPWWVSARRSKKAIGLGYVARERARDGQQLTLTADSGTLSARIVAIPFFDPKGTRIRV